MIVIGGTIESDPVQDTYDPLPWEGTWRGSNGYYDDAVRGVRAHVSVYGVASCVDLWRSLQAVCYSI